MQTEVKTDGLIVLSKGTLVANKNSSFNLRLEDSFDINITLEESSKQGIKANAIKGGVELTLQGFNNSLGTATKKPIEIAKREDKTIFISLCVYAINDSRILIYNVLSEV